MCDTLCKLGRDPTYFAKNSDREPNEAQYVEYYPSADFRSKVKATYIEVDFNAPVNAVLISRPYWMWGAEMGVNEMGVAIGNEAIFSRSGNKIKGLLGMDLLRLGLEQGKSARQAMDVMIEYTESYGIGGSNSHRTGLYYDNSFLITDINEAFVLETEGKEHEVKVIEREKTISNFPSVRSYKLNKLYSTLGKGSIRQKKTSSSIENVSDVRDIIGIMRSHHDVFTHPRNGDNEDICMHGGFMSRRDQTANSFVIELRKEFIITWTTFSSNPCVSLYKPIIFKDGTILGPSLKEKGYWENTEVQHLNLFRASPDAYRNFQSKILREQEVIFAKFSSIKETLGNQSAPAESEINEFYDYLEKVDAELASSFEGLPPSRSVYNLWINRQQASLKNH